MLSAGVPDRGAKCSVDWVRLVSYAWLGVDSNDVQDSEGGPIVSANWEADRRLGNHPQSAASAPAMAKTCEDGDRLGRHMGSLQVQVCGSDAEECRCTRKRGPGRRGC